MPKGLEVKGHEAVRQVEKRKRLDSSQQIGIFFAGNTEPTIEQHAEMRELVRHDPRARERHDVFSEAYNLLWDHLPKGREVESERPLHRMAREYGVIILRERGYRPILMRRIDETDEEIANGTEY